MNILDLPTEIILMIFSNVGGKDLDVLKLTSKDIKVIIDENDLLWSIIGRKEFNLENCPNDLCCKHEFFYKYFLRKYGNLVGLWITHEEFLYTGLSKIIFTGNGLIFYLQRFGETAVPLLTIYINERRLISVKCGSRNAKIRIHSKDQISIINCESRLPDVLLMRFNPPLCPSDGIIKPGIFMDCDSHEFFCLEYKVMDHYSYVSHHIIIRDVNSCFGGIISTVCLDRPLILNELQQNSIDILEDLETQILPLGMTIHTMPEQPFVVPSNCNYRNKLGHSFRHCKARFRCDEAFNHGHFIIFDDDTFALILFGERSLIMYKRVAMFDK